MPIGSVTTTSPSLSLFGATSSRAASDAAIAKLNRDAAEQSQLEGLYRHMLSLKDALRTIRDNWRRSDDVVPGSAASATSTSVLASADEATQALSDLAAFAGTTAGDLEINGTAIAFDPAADSLQDIIDRINAAGVGATAALAEDGLGLVLTADDEDADLALGDGGSGLLSALDITAGTYEPASAGTTPGMSWSRAGIIAEATSDAVAAVNAIFGDDLTGGEESSVLKRARDDLRKAVEAFWKNDTTDLPRDLGFTQEFDAEFGDVVSFSRRTEQEMVRTLRSRPASVETMLFGKAGEGRAGLVGQLEMKANAIDQRLGITFERRGIVVNTLA